MFKRLVSNLPYNPSLISQVTFYSKRIKQERFIRRLGFIAIAITMTFQALVVISPPERSLAASSNHIINGLRTRDDILNAWDQPGSDIPAIYESVGLTRADIEALPRTPNVTLKSTDNDYWSIGRNSLQGYSGVDEQFKNSQISIQYSGRDSSDTSDDRFIHQRQLKAWDVKNPSSNYRAFEGQRISDGEKFWILVDCGNYTRVGKTPPKKPQDKPKLQIKKSIENKPDHFSPGDTITYKLSFRNKTQDTLAENVVIEDQLDTKLFNVSDRKTDTYSITNGFFRYEHGGLAYDTSYTVIPLEVKLKDQINSGSTICNQARITASNASAQTSNEACIGVITECPFHSTIPDANNPNCVEPKLVCKVVDFALNRTTRTVSYKTTVSSSNPANTTVSGYTYDFGDDATQTYNSSSFTHEADHTYQPGEYTAEVKVAFQTTGQESADDQNITCSAPVSFDEDEPLGQSKQVSNITQDVDGELALNATVEAGDVLEYTVITTNPQNYERTNVNVSDYIGDILEYAGLDEAALAENGGDYNTETKKVEWSNVTIPASSSLEQTFRVIVKDPIPTTNLPSALGTSFDCKISNEYGNEITMNINCPLVKGLETLPNTGPGSSIVMSGLITTTVGYFYARSRLLSKEIDLVRADYTGGRA